MQIIEYFTSNNREHWLDEIARCDWDAGQYLCELLKEDKLSELVGEGVRVIMLTEGDELVSFCTLAAKDDVQPTELTPWIGWIYTFPRHRGSRRAGLILSHAEALAKADGHENIYISTNHVGLYEKYGYTFYKTMKDIGGDDTRVYVKALSQDA
jgi:GNAT superfamily N-acetyltransferase